MYYNLKEALDACTQEQVTELKILLNYLEERKVQKLRGSRSILSPEQQVCLFIYADIQKNRLVDISLACDLNQRIIHSTLRRLRTFCKVLNIFDGSPPLGIKDFSLGLCVLTHSDRQMLFLLVNGYSKEEIARIRGIRLTSVETRIKILYDKTNTNQIQGLIACALKNGLAAIDGFNCCFLQNDFRE